MGGLRAKFYDTTFKRTSAANGNGGAVVVASDFDKMNVTERSAADFTRCTFEDFQADFYGQAVFSSVAQLRLFDSHLAADEGMSLAAGTVFDFGVTRRSSTRRGARSSRRTPRRRCACWRARRSWRGGTRPSRCRAST